MFLSGHGYPVWLLNGNTLVLKSYMARSNQPRYLPAYVLLQELNSPTYTLQYVEEITLAGQPVLHLHISDDSDPVAAVISPQEWYFSSDSFLPARVQFRAPSNEDPTKYVNVTFDMLQYRAVSDLLVPSTISYAQDDALPATISIEAVAFNSGVSQAEFDPPQGGQQ